MFKFGKKSKECIAQLDPRLQCLVNLMMSRQVMDFSITCGHRGEAEQNKAVADGKSKLVFPKSKHNSNPSLAYDRQPYPVNWDPNHESWDKLAALESECAAAIGIDVKNDISWDRPHCELKG